MGNLRYLMSVLGLFSNVRVVWVLTVRAGSSHFDGNAIAAERRRNTLEVLSWVGVARTDSSTSRGSGLVRRIVPEVRRVL
jgi:hypothetical protein